MSLVPVCCNGAHFDHLPIFLTVPIVALENTFSSRNDKCRNPDISNVSHVCYRWNDLYRDAYVTILSKSSLVREHFQLMRNAKDVRDVSNY
jgi:hypothetical protein